VYEDALSYRPEPTSGSGSGSPNRRDSQRVLPLLMTRWKDARGESRDIREPAAARECSADPSGNLAAYSTNGAARRPIQPIDCTQKP
jgi:hypothetical protein